MENYVCSWLRREKKSGKQRMPAATAPIQNPTPYPPYIHEPLPSERSIRILNLISWDANARRIVASIDTVELDLANFYALSYTWGNPLDLDPDEPEKEGTEIADGCDLLIVPTTYSLRSNGTSDIGIHDVDRLEESQFTTLPIAQNLSAFLRTFCSGLGRTDPTKPFPIWIDAICVNQADSTEKGTHIPLMGEIYARATQVIVWFGPANSETETFVWMHGAMLSTMESVMSEAASPDRYHEAVMHLGRHDPLDSEFWDAKGLALQKAGDTWAEYWLVYLSFYNRRRWFRRSWIVQEVCLASQILPFCGDWLLDWSILQHFARVLEASGWYVRLIVMLEVPGTSTININPGHFGIVQRMIGEIVAKQDSSSQTWTQFWCRMLDNILIRESTVPADKVYCLLGMAKICFPFLESELQRLDYTTEASNVYLWLTKLILRRSRTLDILGFSDVSDSRDLNIPSWLPDFDSGGKAPHERISAYANIPWEVAAQYNITAEFIVDGSELCLTGRRCARFSKIGNNPELTSMERALEIAVALGGSLYRDTSQTIGEAIWRCFVLGGDERHELVGPTESSVEVEVGDELGFRPTSYADAMAQGLHDWALALFSQILFDKLLKRESPFKWMQRIGELLAKLSPQYPFPSVAEVEAEFYLKMDDACEQLEPLRYNDTKHDQYTSIAMDNQNNFTSKAIVNLETRRLFMTDDGHAAMASAFCNEEDEIWLVRGGCVPLVLRPLGHGKYRFMGECYVHRHAWSLSGKRNGEATLELEDIRLL